MAGIECFAGEAELDAFLARTDILVCLLPLTPETEDMLDGRLFAKLPEGAYVINAARGGHLVEGLGAFGDDIDPSGLGKG